MLTPLAKVASAFTLALASLGCAELKPPLTCPAQGGASWTELASLHFTVRTDHSPDEGRAALEELETIYTTFKDVTFPSATDPHDRIDVVLFSRRKDYEVIAPALSDAYFTERPPGEIESRPTMVVLGGFTREVRTTLQHELAHHLLHQALGGMPPWLNEGMAQYYSTLRAEDGKVFLGDPLPDLGFVIGTQWRGVRRGPVTVQVLVPTEEVPPIATLVSADRGTFYRRGASPTVDDARAQTKFYAGAWALVHMLNDGPDEYRHRFNTFISAVHDGGMLDLAWQQSFGDIDPARFEADFRQYLVRTETVLRVTEYTPRPGAPLERERPMSDAEVHLLWAALRPWKAGAEAQIQRDIDEALEREPTSPEVHFQRALFALRTKQLDEGDKELAKALAMKPDEPRYLLLQGRLVERNVPASSLPEGKRQQLEGIVHRLEKVAKTASELNFIGWFYAELGRGDEGLPFGERSVKADPTCWACLDTYALLLSQKGRFEEALAVQQRAINLMPETVFNKDVLTRLHTYAVVVRTRAKARRKASAPEGEQPEEKKGE